jgi:hypothetical protein
VHNAAARDHTDGVQVVGAIVASSIVFGLTPKDDRDDSLLGGNVFVRTPGHTKDRAFGGAPLQPSPSSRVFKRSQYIAVHS